MLIEVKQRLQRMDDLLDAINRADIEDRLRALAYEHVCVRLSGNIERGIIDILRTFAKLRANPDIQRYVEQQLEFFQNPKDIKDYWSAFKFQCGMGAHFYCIH
jgi:hypothetical protein